MSTATAQSHGESAPGLEAPTGVPERAPARWLTPAVLALPFLVTVAALRGLTATLPIFHGSDERVYHLPTILRFGSQLPFPDLAHYGAAQTPLAHLLLAYAGKLIGYQLWRLRLLEVVISYALALAVLGLLHRRLRLPRGSALALSLLFVLSPYVFGTSFRVMTDNLAALFVVLALERLERYRETERLGTFVTGCACVSGAMLTRQSTAFMLPVAALYALRVLGLRHRPFLVRDRLLAATTLLACAAPVLALFLTWHGLVPPGGDPSSCGLCPAGRAGTAASRSALQLRTVELTLATIGLYGGIMFAPLLLSRWAERPAAMLRAARGPVVGAAIGALLLLAGPATPGTHAAGAIWRAARHVPAIDGSSLVFWGLVPLSGAVLWARVARAPRRWTVTVFLGCFLIGALAIRYPWQKYVDPFALLALLMTVSPGELHRPWQLAGAAALAAAFVAYAVSFVA